MPGSRVFARHNDNTIVSSQRLRSELESGRRNGGYSINDEEDEIGSRCLGGSRTRFRRTMVWAISVAGTVLQVNDENHRDLVAKLTRAAAAIARAMEDVPAGA